MRRGDLVVVTLLAVAAFALLVAFTAAIASPWPHPATKQNIIRKIGLAQWHKAERVAKCETGKTVNWYLSGTYRGALGMYRGTWAYGVRATGYDGNTFPEQVGIAVASFPITRGWSGWGCRAA
jgi:hypothetical protein